MPYRRHDPARPYNALKAFMERPTQLTPDAGYGFGQGLLKRPDESARLIRALGALDEDLLVLVGNPANRGLIRQWEIANGRDWPRDPKTGRRYDLAHTKAIADGGKNVLENIRPMHRDEHLLEHKLNGDYSRWAKRPHTAKAFGGRVERSLGALSLIPNILGLLSGRIRTDSFDNFSSDMLGWPSQEDIRLRQEEMRKRFAPDSPPGTLVS